MATNNVDGETTKRQRTKNTVVREDKLSSLPDEILMGILSRLPLELAIGSGSLSRRWRNLWTNITSIHLTYRNSEVITATDAILMQITSPIIHTFTYDFDQKLKYWPSVSQRSINSWVRGICDKNVRELKVAIPRSCRGTIPSFVFKSQSLVSVELDTAFCSPLPDLIDLPNLKRLIIVNPPLWNWEWFDKLMKGCPLLEELSLEMVNFDYISEEYIRHSHHNVKQFSICLALHNIQHMLTLVSLCPALDVLILKFQERGYNHLNLAELVNISVLQSVKKIEIRTYYHTYLNCAKCIWDLVESMLSNLMCLEEFDFLIIGEHYNELVVQEELKLSKLLYSCPVVSTTCEVRFVGRIFQMSRKAGPNAWKANGEVITLD